MSLSKPEYAVDWKKQTLNRLYGLAFIMAPAEV